jgi:ATP-dependent DNA helicase DinG
MSSLSDTIDSIFSSGGALSEQELFEHRPQQQAMALAIARALEHREHLIVEAPTGIGKTLAYLVPAVVFGLETNRKAIISTHTKNLQEQVLRSDIPIAHKLIKAPFTAAVLKGRHNYLCTTRLRQALAMSTSLFDAEERNQVKRIHDWSKKTVDGDRENLPFVPHQHVWDRVASEQDVCSSIICGQQCFFQRAKERARTANVVIMNHALFFTLMVMQNSDDHFIFERDFVIFDEAHMLETVAGTGWGKTVSRLQVMRTLTKLYNTRTKKGLLAQQPLALKKQCRELEQEAETFFDAVHQACTALAQDSGNGRRTEVRIRTPHLVANTLAHPLARMQQTLKKVEEENNVQSLKQEFAAARRELWETEVLTTEFLDQGDQGLAYWVQTSDRHPENVTLCTAPVDISPFIAAKLFRSNTSVVLTSATLSVGGTLDYCKQRIGAGGAHGLILDSPFDYARQMQLCIARDIPEPDREEYMPALPGWVFRCIKRSHGRALVLFTNSSAMRQTAAAIRRDIEDAGLKLFVQGVDGQRHELLELFRSDIDSVLFGLESFWMGIDVPGEALENVVITRLPFQVPSHPLTEARLEAIALRGGSAFLEYQLPEAVLRFRQGAGRLLRRKTDRGCVTILDSRILTKPYGKIFLSSLPRCPVILLNREGETETIPSEEL